MSKTIFALGIAVLLVLSLALVPSARALWPAQSSDAADDPNAPMAALPAGFGGAANLDSSGKRPAEAVSPTDEQKANAMSKGDVIASGAISVPDAEALAASTEPLVQADGTAMYSSGFNIGGSGSADGSGTLGGSGTGTPSLSPPFPYVQSGWNVPIMTRTIGVVYFNNSAYGCPVTFCYVSGAVITSGNGTFANYDMVLTEAWALRSTTGITSSNVEFCPAEAYGPDPYGCWQWQFMYWPLAWQNTGTERQDYGLIDTYDGGGGHTAGSVASVVGAQGVAWNQPHNQYFWFAGYTPPKTVPFMCTAPLARLNAAPGAGPLDLEIGCGMAYGADGGPFIISGKVANKGFANGVGTIHNLAESWYGPYFNTAFGTLYLSVRE